MSLLDIVKEELNNKPIIKNGFTTAIEEDDAEDTVDNDETDTDDGVDDTDTNDDKDTDSKDDTEDNDSENDDSEDGDDDTGDDEDSDDEDNDDENTDDTDEDDSDEDDSDSESDDMSSKIKEVKITIESLLNTVNGNRMDELLSVLESGNVSYPVISLLTSVLNNVTESKLQLPTLEQYENSLTKDEFIYNVQDKVKTAMGSVKLSDLRDIANDVYNTLNSINDQINTTSNTYNNVVQEFIRLYENTDLSPEDQNIIDSINGMFTENVNKLQSNIHHFSSVMTPLLTTYNTISGHFKSDMVLFKNLLNNNASIPSWLPIEKDGDGYKIGKSVITDAITITIKNSNLFTTEKNNDLSVEAELKLPVITDMGVPELEMTLNKGEFDYSVLMRYTSDTNRNTESKPITPADLYNYVLRPVGVNNVESMDTYLSTISNIQSVLDGDDIAIPVGNALSNTLYSFIAIMLNNVLSVAYITHYTDIMVKNTIIDRLSSLKNM